MAASQFLPPYLFCRRTSDFNLTEHVFAKLYGLLRKDDARNVNEGRR